MLFFVLLIIENNKKSLIIIKIAKKESDQIFFQNVSNFLLRYNGITTEAKILTKKL